MKVKNIKNVLLICIFFSTFKVLAKDHQCVAQVRSASHKLVSSLVTINDLKDGDSFSGKFFKIVEGINKEPIKFDSPLSMRACHVYYHLSKARDYFVNLGLDHLDRASAITIRLEITRGFSDVGHFLHEKHGEFHNNALTIPESDKKKHESIESWGKEIWFAPMKKVKVQSNMNKAADIASSNSMLKNMFLGVIEGQMITIGQQIAAGAKLTLLEGEYYLKSILMSVGVMALIPNVIKLTTSAFKKTIFLDSAMIPEVIYHEYSHYALSPFVDISKHSPVTEGIANFYAALISNTDTILAKSNKYMKGLVKISSKQNKMYDFYMEDSAYSQLDFTFKFLYALKENLGEDKATQLVLFASKKLKGRELSIKGGLLDSLFDAVLEFNKSEQAIIQAKLHRVIQSFGL